MATAMSANCMISPEPLLEQFNCPICLNIMKDVWVTVCFHRFCEECIKESINSNHRCPLCNKDLQQDNIQRDAQYNTLLEAIDKAIQDAEAHKAASFANQIVTQIGDNSVRTILEELFRDTLVTSLANHLTSENDMRSRYKRKKSDIEAAYNRAVVRLQEKKSTKEEYKNNLDELTIKFKDDIKKLDEEIRNVQVLFIQAYKNHLNEHVSNFGAVSTQVRVTLWKEDHFFKNKDNQYPIILMRPEDRMEILLQALDELILLNNDKVVKTDGVVLFTCINSLDDLSEQSVIKRLKRMDIEDDDDDDDNNSLLTVSRNCRPILEHKLLRGTLVVIHGEVVLESEIPKKCFKQIYHEDPHQKHLVDYFQCQQCGKDGKPLRWICKSCARACHKNHDITPLMFGNEASGPKCDCNKSDRRKNVCQIYPRN
ncbi:unnamed protein product [Rotaria socialis]|uniref:RING-type domain-containing protein n=1 Tax=Rotaria socialis TaxID=392032 RepID=A0A817YFT4_9BILA|nr:unnamed protein product [Rotaria socialis]CAF3379867.1 unnamed protein product [Rotaria socialis]CAF4406145.1 unnamed protein product [Rotaria socialis]CAF4622009.1 unnamed protein product [Rotaria socialis]